jgi:hypothetical protein
MDSMKIIEEGLPKKVFRWLCCVRKINEFLRDKKINETGIGILIFIFGRCHQQKASFKFINYQNQNISLVFQDMMEKDIYNEKPILELRHQGYVDLCQDLISLTDSGHLLIYQFSKLMNELKDIKTLGTKGK